MPAAGPDPYTTAVSNGFAAETDNPVDALLSDIAERCPLRFYGAECGVVGGVNGSAASR